MNAEEKGMSKYTLNVDPDREHDLTDAEVADLRALGFTASRARSAAPARTSPAPAEKPATEKKEG